MDKKKFKESIVELTRQEVSGLSELKKHEFILSVVKEEFSSTKQVKLYCGSESCGEVNLVNWPDHQSYLKVKCCHCGEVYCGFVSTVRAKRRRSLHGQWRYLYTFRVITLEGNECQFDLLLTGAEVFEARSKDLVALTSQYQNGYGSVNGKVINCTVDKNRWMKCSDEEFLIQSAKILKKLEPVSSVRE